MNLFDKIVAVELANTSGMAHLLGELLIWFCLVYLFYFRIRLGSFFILSHSKYEHLSKKQRKIQEKRDRAQQKKREREWFKNHPGKKERLFAVVGWLKEWLKKWLFCRCYTENQKSENFPIFQTLNLCFLLQYGVVLFFWLCALCNPGLRHIYQLFWSGVIFAQSFLAITLENYYSTLPQFVGFCRYRKGVRLAISLLFSAALVTGLYLVGHLNQYEKLKMDSSIT